MNKGNGKGRAPRSAKYTRAASSIIPVAVIRDSGRKQLREGRSHLTPSSSLQSITAGKSWQWELKAASHITQADEQREMNVSLLSTQLTSSSLRQSRTQTATCQSRHTYVNVSMG